MPNEDRFEQVGRAWWLKNAAVFICQMAGRFQAYDATPVPNSRIADKRLLGDGVATLGEVMSRVLGMQVAQ